MITKSFKTSRLCPPDHLPHILEHLGPDQVDTGLVHVLALVVAPASTQYETEKVRKIITIIIIMIFLTIMTLLHPGQAHNMRHVDYQLHCCTGKPPHDEARKQFFDTVKQ